MVHKINTSQEKTESNCSESDTVYGARAEQTYPERVQENLA